MQVTLWSVIDAKGLEAKRIGQIDGAVAVADVVLAIQAPEKPFVERLDTESRSGDADCLKSLQQLDRDRFEGRADPREAPITLGALNVSILSSVDAMIDENR